MIGDGKRVFGVEQRQMSDEHVIITALVRQLGGAVTISFDEIRTADKVKHMTSWHYMDPDRFVIEVED